eukprot:UN27255
MPQLQHKCLSAVMTFEVIFFFVKKIKYQSQKTLLANNSIENIVDKEHIQQRPASILLRSMGDQQKRASRLQNRFNWVNKSNILSKLVRQVEHCF